MPRRRCGRRCHWSMPLGRARGLAAAPPALAFRAVAEQRSSAAAEWREGSGARRPSRLRVASRPQILSGRPHRRGVRWAPCGSGSAVLVCSVSWSEPRSQAKGGDGWWAAGRRAGPGRSASRPDRGSTRAAGAPAGPGPMTRVRAPRRPATGAAGRAASTAGRSTATATCSMWSTAPGRWRRSWTGCGRPRGR